MASRIEQQAEAREDLAKAKVTERYSERDRCRGIIRIARLSRMSLDWIDLMIANGTAVEEAERDAVSDHMEKLSCPTRIDPAKRDEEAKRQMIELRFNDGEAAAIEFVALHLNPVDADTQDAARTLLRLGYERWRRAYDQIVPLAAPELAPLEFAEP